MKNTEISISVSGLLPTKENIGTAATAMVELCRAGEVNPLDLMVKLSALEKVCELVKEQIKQQALTELDKYPQGKTIHLGANVDRKEVGVKWNYENSGAWVKMSKKAEEAIAKRKEVEKMAQTIPEGQSVEIADTETGEMLTVSRGIKTSTTSLAVTLGK